VTGHDSSSVLKTKEADFTLSMQGFGFLDAIDAVIRFPVFRLCLFVLEIS
jgi:hypothetical protein